MIVKHFLLIMPSVALGLLECNRDVRAVNNIGGLVTKVLGVWLRIHAPLHLRRRDLQQRQEEGAICADKSKRERKRERERERE